MERELDLPCVSMNGSGATAPWTRLSMKTEFATKDYVLDVKKDLKNISSDFNERSLHSVVCMEKQLSADTLNRIWADSLRARHIVAKTSIQIVTADSSKCIRSEGSCDNDCFVSPIWVAYVGNECEVEVVGFLSSTLLVGDSILFFPICPTESCDPYFVGCGIDEHQGCNSDSSCWGDDFDDDHCMAMT